MDDSAQPPVYDFEGFSLDTRRGVLCSQSDGRPVELTPRAFGTLLYLVERAGQLVEKGALLAALWPNVVVEDGNLTQTIYVLRRALGERPDEHRFIVTVPGRGYRFVAAVTRRAEQSTEDTETASSPEPVAATAAGSKRAGWIAGIALALGALAIMAVWAYRAREADSVVSTQPIQSIAVLPFVDMSPSGDSAYFSDGLAEELLNLLAHIPELRVIARTSSFSFRGQSVDIATIAQKLQVGHVLEGSVRKAGDKVRITAQLIDAADSSHVWSETYERDLTDVFAVQSEIATAVADALKLKLRTRQSVTVVAPTGTEAYEHFLRGQFLYGRRGPRDLDNALSAYQQALELDPHYARAWAGVAAVSFIQVYEGHVAREVGLPRLLDAAQKAIAYNPQLAEGHLRLSNYYHLVGQPETAARHYRRGALLNPESPLVLGTQAGYAAKRGNYEDAIELARRVISLDPLSVTGLNNLAAFMIAAGRLEEARVEMLKSYDIARLPDDALSISHILMWQRKHDEALAFIDRNMQGADRAQALALVYHALGRASEADVALGELIALAGDRDAFRIAEVYAYRGDAAESFRWLNLATKAHDSFGRSAQGHMLWEMRVSPFLEPLHDDPRWNEWVATTRNE
jgi:TolB-like protein/DNA-binding winged helix-turn-helix (wHTH) protein/lipoprotein NlpI